MRRTLAVVLLLLLAVLPAASAAPYFALNDSGFMGDAQSAYRWVSNAGLYECPEDARVLMAAYDEQTGVLLSAGVFAPEYTTGGVLNYFVLNGLPKDEGLLLKMFAWDGAGAMSPICDPYEGTLTPPPRGKLGVVLGYGQTADGYALTRYTQDGAFVTYPTASLVDVYMGNGHRQEIERRRYGSAAGSRDFANLFVETAAAAAQQARGWVIDANDAIEFGVNAVGEIDLIHVAGGGKYFGKGVDGWGLFEAKRNQIHVVKPKGASTYVDITPDTKLIVAFPSAKSGTALGDLHFAYNPADYWLMNPSELRDDDYWDSVSVYNIGDDSDTKLIVIRSERV